MGCTTTLVHRMAVRAGRLGLSRVRAAGRGRRTRVSRLWTAPRWMGWILAMDPRARHTTALDSAWSMLELPTLARAAARLPARAASGRGGGDRPCAGAWHRDRPGHAESGRPGGRADDNGTWLAAPLASTCPSFDGSHCCDRRASGCGRCATGGQRRHCGDTSAGRRLAARPPTLR